MSFSEKMRESLGAMGVRLSVTPSDTPLSPGEALAARLEMAGGNAPAHVEAIVLRLIEADRHWTDDEGVRHEENEVASLQRQDHLTAGWDRRTIAEARIAVNAEIDASDVQALDLELPIPAECAPSSVSCAHTLNVQADIKGQIDPTANARVVLGGR